MAKKIVKPSCCDFFKTKVWLNDDEALINYAKPSWPNCANMVRVDADFSATPFKAKISNAEQLRVHAMLVIGDRDMEGGMVSVRLHQAARKARSRRGSRGGHFGEYQRAKYLMIIKVVRR